MRQAISRGMVALLKQYLGRGPTQTRAYVDDGLLTVLLHETQTEVERTLVAAGDIELVKSMRRNYNDALCADAVALVERETGRAVSAFISGNSVTPDYTVMCFVLGPEAAGEGDYSPCNDGVATDPPAQSSPESAPV